MTFTLYKDGRAKWKLCIFTAKYGLETFRVKGKKELKRKISAIKELYGTN